MLQVNQWLDKLAAMCSNFAAHGMLSAGHAAGRQVSHILDDDNNGPVEEQNILWHVTLAQTHGTSSILADELISNFTKHASIHRT
jgi:hypothetical protein